MDRAADSIAEIITANAGSSVLTECNKKLHDQFGVLAIKNSPSHLSNLADYYISNSADGLKSFIHLKLNAVFVDTGVSNNLYITDFKKQISSLGIKNIVFGKRKESGLTSFAGKDLPSKRFNSFFDISAADVSSVLDGSRLLNTAGESFGITEYVMHIFTDEEIEYLIFGNPDAQSNRNSTKNLIFAIRCIINCTEEIEEPLLWIEAIARAWNETDAIMNEPLELEKYLRAMVAVLSGMNKLSYRIMDIMQLTVGGDFNFKDYCYGFTLTAQYKRGSKHGTVTQIHKYTK